MNLASALQLLADHSLAATTTEADRLAVYDAVSRVVRSMVYPPEQIDNEVKSIGQEASIAGQAMREADRAQMAFADLLAKARATGKDGNA